MNTSALNAEELRREEGITVSQKRKYVGVYYRKVRLPYNVLLEWRSMTQG